MIPEQKSGRVSAKRLTYARLEGIDSYSHSHTGRREETGTAGGVRGGAGHSSDH